jgi:transmembrane protein TMEM260 (protein O-mannosyltransferase)
LDIFATTPIPKDTAAPNLSSRIVNLAVGTFALGIYLVTLAPTITWRNNGADSGDLVSAAFTLGIPHPTGYPLFTILASFLSHLPFGEPAKNVNVLSALVSAGTIVLICALGREFLQDPNSFSRWIPPSFATAFAFAPALWSQATIAEVNALATFFATALIATLLSDSPRRLYYAAAIFGLGLAHHLTIVLLVPFALILLASERWRLAQILLSLCILIMPLLLYLYLPIRASAHPLINWGDPESLDGFLWVVGGGPYHLYLFSLTLGETLARVASTAGFLIDQFTVLGVGLGLWGAAQMGMRSDNSTRRRFVALLSAFTLPIVYAVVYGSRDSFIYLLPAFLVFLLWMMYGASDLTTRAKLLQDTVAKRQVGSTSAIMLRSQPVVLLGAIVLLLTFFPLYNLVVNFGTLNVSSDHSAYDYATKIFNDMPRQSVIIADGDEHLFSLQYYRNVVAPHSEVVVVSEELLQFSWYFDQMRQMIPGINASALDTTDRLVEVVDASLAQGRSVYSTVQNEPFSRYEMEARDGYFHLTMK